MSVSLSFNDSEDEVNDLKLTVGEQTFIYSSFLWVGQYSSRASRAEGVRRELVRLLEAWADGIRGLRVGEMIYLPYEWEDECLGCIQCRKIGDELELLVGTLPLSAFGAPTTSVFTA